MEISVSVNARGTEASLDRWVEKAVVAAGKALGQVGLAVERQAIANASGPPVKKGNHVPWGGEGPNMRTGWLRKNIMARPPVRQGFGSYTQDVVSGASYSRSVELGTARTGKYPFMKPAFDKVSKEAQTIFDRAYKKYRAV